MIWDNLLPFCVLIFAFTRLVLSDGNSDCKNKLTCDSCIGTAGCTWCTQLKEPYSQFERCNSLEGQRQNGCPNEAIYQPKSAKPKMYKTINDEPISNTVRIQPQRIQLLNLTVEQEVPIRLNYNDKTDRDLDLYYIMDLSATMENDKKTVSAQAVNLVNELQKITKKVRLGFGSFIDKPLLPFVSASQLRPDPEGKYEIPYGFKNHLNLTTETGRFRDVVRKAKISRNVDEPEGAMDALIQAITCVQEIGWKPEARKLIVVATDGPFHIAGDGKLGGIVRPNDLKCHMENNVYTHSTILDYPSIGEINAVILDHKVYVIFAVSTLQGNDVFSVYNDLKEHITQSAAVKLKEDSSNVVQIIRTKYLELSKRVFLRIESRPSFVDVNVYAKCSDKAGFVNQEYCDDVAVGQSVEFSIRVILKECPDPRKHQNIRKNQIVVSFFQLSEQFIIDLSYACECGCNEEKNDNQNDLERYCNGKEASKYISGCGVCICKDDRTGVSCQCSKTGDNDFGNNTTNCINPENPSRGECSNWGRCNCGQCECPVNYNGKYCEDSTIDCQKDGIICSDNGQCEKGECKCREGYNGKYCECEASKKVSFCVEPGKSSSKDCNGNGQCICSGTQARCNCNPNYTGTYCEVCIINCPSSGGLNSRCNEKFIKQCVRCRLRQFYDKKNVQCTKQCDVESYLAQRGSTGTMKRNDVGSYDFQELEEQTSLSDITGTECVVSFNSSCKSYFRYSYQRGSEQQDVLKVYYSPHKPECSIEPPVIWYTLGVIIGVLLLGILGLLIWKLATYLHDTREYKRFQKETSQAKWQGGENPLYNKPESEFQNPAYRN